VERQGVVRGKEVEDTPLDEMPQLVDIGRGSLVKTRDALNETSDALNDASPSTAGRGEQEEVGKGGEQKRTPSSGACVEQEASYSAFLANPALSLVSHRLCVSHNSCSKLIQYAPSRKSFVRAGGECAAVESFATAHHPSAFALIRIVLPFFSISFFWIRSEAYFAATNSPRRPFFFRPDPAFLILFSASGNYLVT